MFQIRIQSGKGSGDLFSTERKVYLVFFKNREQINKSDIISIKKDEVITKEYSFDGNTEIKILLLDATSKEQLDEVLVKQNKDRDLSDLL